MAKSRNPVTLMDLFDNPKIASVEGEIAEETFGTAAHDPSLSDSAGSEGQSPADDATAPDAAREMATGSKSSRQGKGKTRKGKSRKGKRGASVDEAESKVKGSKEKAQIYLTPLLRDALRFVAYVEHRPVSVVIEEAVEAYISQRPDAEEVWAQAEKALMSRKK